MSSPLSSERPGIVTPEGAVFVAVAAAVAVADAVAAAVAVAIAVAVEYVARILNDAVVL